MQLVRFNSMTRSQSASVILSIGCGVLPPALLTTISTRPSRLSGFVGQTL